MESEPSGLALSIIGLLIGASVAINVSSLFPTAQVELFPLEGGYVDHVDDLGGATNLGITEKLARQYGYEGDMRDLPMETALVIAYREFWEPLQLDAIATLEDTLYMNLALQLYKFGFHAGRGRSVELFQRCLNVLNQDQRLYPDIRVDRGMGRRTLAAFEAYRAGFGESGVEPIVTCVDGLTIAYYVHISERRPQNESFTRGWLNRLGD